MLFSGVHLRAEFLPRFLLFQRFHGSYVMQVLIVNVGVMHMIWTSVMNIVKHPNLLVPLIFWSWHMSANGLSFPKTLKEAILVYVTMTTLLEARQALFLLSILTL